MKTMDILKHFESQTLRAGEIIELKLKHDFVEELGYKAFVDLAQIFFLKMLTPQINVDEIILKFQKLNEEKSFHKELHSSEKYGLESEFFNIDKNKQFSFLYYYKKALEFIDVKSKKSILNLGVNKGDEFLVIQKMLKKDEFNSKKIIGIDYSQSVIKYAKKEFNKTNINFINHDINNLDELNIGKFDLIISIGTLQSSNINFNERFMDIYQNYLEKDGSIILGFPNCRWIDSEMIYGAKAPNYSFSELSLVLKDIHFTKKYLQQKKYRVIITGKDYFFLTARKIILP
jgi:2-polyprenyl-3-methyl-5-hydroxy-6-metoxy-1,4-benzoquinol methylase